MLQELHEQLDTPRLRPILKVIEAIQLEVIDELPEIVYNLGMEDLGGLPTGVTFSMNNITYVWINPDSPHKVTTLLHELGHIFMCHIFDDCEKEDEQREQEADVFALHLYKFFNLNEPLYEHRKNVVTKRWLRWVNEQPNVENMCKMDVTRRLLGFYQLINGKGVYDYDTGEVLLKQ